MWWEFKLNYHEWSVEIFPSIINPHFCRGGGSREEERGCKVPSSSVCSTKGVQKDTHCGVQKEMFHSGNAKVAPLRVCRKIKDPEQR